MAKKDKKKVKAAKPAKKTASKKPVKKTSKPAPKKAVKKVAKKVAPKKIVKKAAPKKAVKKVAPKKVVAKKPIVKVAPKKAEVKKSVKAELPKKLTGKPIDAISKKGAKVSPKAKKGSKKGDDDDDDDADVKDDYEKADEDDEIVGDLDEPAILEGEAEIPPPDDDDDDDEVPIKKGRGRRKKSEGKSSGGSMEAYIRNRPLQIDITKSLIKKSLEAQPKPFVNTKDNRSRYTDKELTEFKGLILEKLKEAQNDYDLLKQTLSNEDNHGTDDTSPSFKLLEDGSDVLSKEETAQLASRQEKYIVNLKNALVRIENKTYGICRVTGKLIPKERLRSVPHATLGIDAKLGQNR